MKREKSTLGDHVFSNSESYSYSILMDYESVLFISKKVAILPNLFYSTLTTLMEIHMRMT